MEKNKLPIIYLSIDEEDMGSGVDTISFVENPATEVSWMKFSKETKLTFQKDEAKRMVTGPVMLAETPIYRYSETIGEYFVKFSEETILSMMKKYFKDGKINRVNEHHNSKRMVEGVRMVESFIVGDRIKSELYPDLPQGTWVATFFIEDEEYWNNTIMNDEFGGFSLEGMFEENYEESIVEEVYSKIEGVINDNTLSEGEVLKKIESLLEGKKG
jgi:hypothetical protein